MKSAGFPAFPKFGQTQHSCRGKNHFAQFYESDGFLLASLEHFVVVGLGNEEAVIIIATEFHLHRLKIELRRSSCDFQAAIDRGQLTLLDARLMLASFMDKAQVDPDAFYHSIGETVARTSLRYDKVRVFGEMVNLLWMQGLADATIVLERLWNEILSLFPVTLLCGYDLKPFGSAEQSASFRAVCDQHSMVIPSERFSGLSNRNEELREIAQLQQKSRALAFEIEERKRTAFALQQSEDLYKGFLDAGRSGSWCYDIPQQLVTWDKALGALMGRPDQGFQGGLEKLIDAVHPGDQDRVLTLHGAPLDRFDREFRFLHEDGNIRWVLARGRLMRDAEGKGSMLLVFVVDISDLKAKESELRQEKEMIDEANQKKARILRKLTGEIRSALSIVLDYAERLKDEDLSEADARLCIDAIARSCFAFSDKVDGILEKTASMPIVTSKAPTLH